MNMKSAMKIRVLKLLIAPALLLSVVSSFGFSIQEPVLSVDEQGFHLTSNLNIEFTEVVIEAIEASIPISIKTEFRIYRLRDLLWNKRVTVKESMEEVKYHAFSKNYIITSGDANVAGYYRTLNDALETMMQQRQWVVEFPEGFTPSVNGRYLAKMRVSLDRSKLPAILRTRTYFNQDWRLSSDWVELE